MSNLSFGSGGHLRRPLKGSPAHVSNPFGSGPQVRYPASYPSAATWRGSHVAHGFLSPFGHRHSLLGHPVPAGNSALLTVGLPGNTWTLTGFPRSARTRFGRGGCPLYPGTVVLSRLDALHQPAPAAFSSGQSCTPLNHPTWPGIALTRHHRGFTCFTRPAFPSPVVPGWSEDPWASPWASDPAVTHDARQDGDEPRALARTYTFGISRPPIRCVHLRCATSCRTHRSSSLRCGRCMWTPPTRREVLARTQERPTLTPG